MRSPNVACGRSELFANSGQRFVINRQCDLNGWTYPQNHSSTPSRAGRSPKLPRAVAGRFGDRATNTGGDNLVKQYLSCLAAGSLLLSLSGGHLAWSLKHGGILLLERLRWPANMSVHQNASTLH